MWNENQTQFQRIFEASPALQLILDTQFVIVGASDAYVRITHKERKDLMGKMIFDLFPDNPNDPHADGVLNVRSSLNRVIAFGVKDEMPLQRYDVETVEGVYEEHWWCPVNAPVFGADGKVEFIIHQVEDVTNTVNLGRSVSEKDRLYLELQRASRDLDKAVRARDDLLSVCSHELRTPITSLKLQAQLARRKIQKGDSDATLVERVQNFVNQSERQIDRLIRLIEEMLDFSRIASGKLQLHSEIFDLSETIKDEIAELLPQIEAVGCRVDLEIAPHLRVAGDRFRLEQVLINLLTNAMKYASGKHIDVSLTQHGSEIELRVSDTGEGIGAENLRRIFEPYERAVSLKNISGLGLGLFIAKEIVEAHGGTIGVESKVGAGSSFWVKLKSEISA